MLHKNDHHKDTRITNAQLNSMIMNVDAAVKEQSGRLADKESQEIEHRSMASIPGRNAWGQSISYRR
jgi:hypothetical protein